MTKSKKENIEAKTQEVMCRKTDRKNSEEGEKEVEAKK